jgi:hypothetical protein
MFIDVEDCPAIAGALLIACDVVPVELPIGDYRFVYVDLVFTHRCHELIDDY